MKKAAVKKPDDKAKAKLAALKAKLKDAKAAAKALYGELVPAEKTYYKLNRAWLKADNLVRHLKAKIVELG